MIYRFDNVPTGVTFGWGGRGFAAKVGNRWIAYIHQSGCHPNSLTWGDKPIIAGEWDPLPGDHENMFPIGETMEKVGNYWKNRPYWAEFEEVFKRFATK